jgi:predicted PurR-regulated permease PerM
MIGTTRNAVLVIAAIAVIWMLHWARAFAIPLVVGIFVAFWLTPIVDRLERVRIPRALAAALVLVAFLGGASAIVYSLRDDTQALINSLPAAARHVQSVVNQALREPNGWLHHLHIAVTRVVPLANGATTAPASAANTASAVAFPGTLMQWSTSALSAIADFAVILFLLYFLLASGDMFKRKLVTAVAGGLARRRVTVEMLSEIGAQLQSYLVVLVITNVTVGILTWLAFWVIGVEHAAVWGVATTVVHVVPYLGAAVIAVASGLASSLQFESLSQGAMVMVVTLVLSSVVGMLLTTWLASRASSMNAAAIFIGLLFWGWLWGIPGLLLGTPLMMAIKVVADRVDALHWVSSFLSEAPKAEQALQSQAQ